MKSDMNENTREALYFGCWDCAGHYLHTKDGRTVRNNPTHWDINLMDGGFLKNGKVADDPNGKVYWTCGGRPEFWYAFYWWDRSVDTRGACNSGFYVRGFGHHEPVAAFKYACEQFKNVVARQKFPLELQNIPAGQTAASDLEMARVVLRSNEYLEVFWGDLAIQQFERYERAKAEMFVGVFNAKLSRLNDENPKHVAAEKAVGVALQSLECITKLQSELFGFYIAQKVATDALTIIRALHLENKEEQDGTAAGQ
jgi:hypothetical protein